MRYKLLIYADSLFFLPCYLLEKVYKNFRAFISIQNRSDKVVIFKFFGIGNIIRITSILEEYNVDKENIMICTFKSNEEICKILGYRNTFFFENNIFKYIKNFFDLILSIRNQKFQYIIDFERSSNLVGMLRMICAVLTSTKTVFLNHLNKEFQTANDISIPLKNDSMNNLIEKTINYFPTKNTENEKISQKSIQIDNKKVIININASNYLLERRLPREKFFSIIKKLQKRNSGLKFYITGTKDEFEYVSQLCKDLNNGKVKCFNVAGKWSLEELSKELISSVLFITNDSGPMHLAVYLKVETIAIWGPTHYKIFGYENIPYLTNISSEMDCSPCFTHPKSKVAGTCKGEITCLKKLNEDLIINKANSILSKANNFRFVNLFIPVKQNNSGTKSYSVNQKVF